MKKKGMVFGVFDGLHQGHRYFLDHAFQVCDELIVVLTLEQVVKKLKGKIPQQNYAERRAAIKKFNPDLKIVRGDAEIGTWNIFKKYRPDIIIVGYDQKGIARELEKMKMPFIFIDAHMPEKYKSSLLIYA